MTTATMPLDAPEMPQDAYIETTTVVEAAGHRFTLFVQILPELMTEKIKADTQELDRLFQLLRVWNAFKNFADHGRFKL